MIAPSITRIVREGVVTHNPAWNQLLGLCPLLAVSNSMVNALGLALASGFVLVGSNATIALLRHAIPPYARLPGFVLIIATFTTAAVLLLEAYAYAMFIQIALFVQIIVTNCMILGRAEAFAAKQNVGRAIVDAVATAVGFAIALLVLGAVRELVGQGTLLVGIDRLLPVLADTAVGSGYVISSWTLPLAALPPGAFIIAGLLLALGKIIGGSGRRVTSSIRDDPS